MCLLFSQSQVIRTTCHCLHQDQSLSEFTIEEFIASSIYLEFGTNVTTLGRRRVGSLVLGRIYSWKSLGIRLVRGRVDPSANLDIRRDEKSPHLPPSRSQEPYLFSHLINICIYISSVFCPRAGHSLQTQAPRLQFCPKTGLPLQTQEPRLQFY